MATRKSNVRSLHRSASQVHKDDYIFDEEVYVHLGTEMAQQASKQVSDAGSYWEKCRNLYVAAQDHGRAQDALRALFSPGDTMQGRKAPWYRTYKSLLTSCFNMKIKVQDTLGMTAVQALIKAAKQQIIDRDPRKRAEKDAQVLEMYKRLAQGCLNRGITKQQLVAALKDLQPEVPQQQAA